MRSNGARCVLILVLAGWCLSSAGADTPPAQLARDSGCLMCHAIESPPASASQVLPSAPAFQDIARRYRGDSHAKTRLIAVVRQGSGREESQRHWTGQAGFS